MRLPFVFYRGIFLVVWAMRYEKNIVQPLTLYLQIAYMSQETQEFETDDTMVLLGRPP